MTLSITECLVMSWIYGVDRFMKDIELMTGKKPSNYWKFMWQFFSPALVLTTLIFNIYNMQRVSLEDYTFPEWAVMVGWVFGVMAIVPLPICAAYAVSRIKTGSLRQRILLLCQPAVNFGPVKEEDRECYFQSFNEFDWIRYRAAKRGMDWRTYKEYKANKSHSGVSSQDTAV
ncbi:hypothetical protein EGW08_004080 [Elysia chlorotica]|uniref:Uncharacterized protein n=1 Tax=Elysia chlorotica TaxID=188477 RepID=A0A433U2Z8_ELYCH|nr:hypothetical protein EGW08_004080 [Elysia chlorotica]